MIEVLDYSKFKVEMKNRIMGYLPDEYKDLEAELVKVPKINGPRDALIVCRDGNGASPNIYLDDLYKEYCRDFDLDRVLKAAARFYADNAAYAGRFAEGSGLGAKDALRRQVVMALVNPKKNKDLLKEAPHKKFLDLEIIYRVMVEDEAAGDMKAATITHSNAEFFGGEAGLDGDALRNLERVLRPEAIIMPDGMGVITNHYKMYGAAAALCPGVLKRAALAAESDLYLVATSMDEFMTIPTRLVGIEALRGTMAVTDGNAPSDRGFLSDSIYLYSRDTNEMTVAEAGPSMS
ncbi:MAG: DUF5688 family protein [Eubacteriales bacterium]|nr:DUF5688 family protein [Eubacteriales bacterium]